MKRNRVATLTLAVLTAFLSGTAAWCAAQSPETRYRELQSALEAAQAQALRPGDEALSCQALESELVTTANDPSVQSVVAKQGAAAQEQQAAINAASSRIASQTAVTVFSSIVPGGGWAGLAMGMAQGQAQQAQAASNIQQRMQQSQEMMGIMPQIMRGARVMELAQARNCAWLRDALSR